MGPPLLSLSPKMSSPNKRTTSLRLTKPSPSSLKRMRCLRSTRTKRDGAKSDAHATSSERSTDFTADMLPSDISSREPLLRDTTVDLSDPGAHMPVSNSASENTNPPNPRNPLIDMKMFNDKK